MLPLLLLNVVLFSLLCADSCVETLSRMRVPFAVILSPQAEVSVSLPCRMVSLISLS